MKLRILSTVSLCVLVFLSLFFYQQFGALILIALVSGFTQYELYKLWEDLELTPIIGAGVLIGSVCLLSPILVGISLAIPILFGSFGLGTIMLTLTLFGCPNRHSFIYTLLPTLAGFILVPLSFAFLTAVVMHFGAENPASGILLGIWILLATKSTDVGGLFAGKFMGKNKLAPSISPGKTWEGVIGGLLLAILVSMLFYASFRSYFPETFGYWDSLILSLLLGLVAILSDLTESIFKRMAHKKDSGQLIPGIGGIYDLSDSLLFSMPVAYGYLTLLL